MSIPAFRCLLLAILLAALSYTRSSAGSAEDAQFAEIVRGWKQLQEMDESGRSYKLTWTQKLASGKPSPLDMISDIRASRSLLLVHSRREKRGQAILAKNPDYCFIISKQPGQEGRGWVLGKFSEEKVEEKNPVLYMVTDHAIYQRFPLSAVLYSSSEEFKKLPSLEILATELLSPTRLRTKYRHRAPTPDTKSTRLVSGEMITDPTRHHCVMEISVEYEKGRPFSASRVVVEQDGQLVCTSVMASIPNPDLSIKTPDLELSQFENIRVNDPVPPEECYLSHYGLPEPVDVKAPRPTRSWWPYLLAGVLLSVLGASFAWYKSRRTRRDAPTT